ncbi:Chitin-binding domain type 2 [Dermatophagoides pteronyssinus]|uniref:Chitin-binding domain type 2 n=1 Tax=Dermatophagoides pteronyssinus TaxID=6956 RepID=A0ABQ8JAT2_DERPT|nr:Chitin-binding domain type 2 [Dermatophagoides pteronyssinus]
MKVIIILSIFVTIFSFQPYGINAAKFKCPEPFGYYEHENCWQFYQCSWFTPFVITCPPFTQWDQRILTCRYITDCKRPPLFPTTTTRKPTTTTRKPITTSTTTTTTRKPTTTTHKPTKITTTTLRPTTTTRRPTTTTRKPTRITTTTRRPTTTTRRSTTTTRRPDSRFECPKANGRFAHKECYKYYQCSQWNAIEMKCPKSTQFDKNQQECVPIYDCPRPALGYECPEPSGYFPHENCWMFYQCGNGMGYEMVCAKGTQWNQTILNCDHLSDCERPDIDGTTSTTTSNHEESTTEIRTTSTPNDNDDDKTTTIRPTTVESTTQI